jgi:ABC-type multidrug transport system fused ATPase/permease subunit
LKLKRGEKVDIPVYDFATHSRQAQSIPMYGANVIIFDEATSSLDNQTEQTVMDAINNLAKHVTIILIAHRLSTIKKCDQIFLLEKGELKHQGTFKELIKVNENFRKSANS